MNSKGTPGQFVTQKEIAGGKKSSPQWIEGVHACYPMFKTVQPHQTVPATALT